MKAKTTKYLGIVLSAAALTLTPAVYAEDEIVAVDDIVTIEVVSDCEDSVCEDTEVVVDEDVDVVVDEDTEVVVEEDDLVEKEIEVTFNPSWVKRGDGDEDVTLYNMASATGGPVPGTSTTTNQTADAENSSVVSKEENNSTTSGVQRMVQKPTAMIKEGRVFLR